MICLAGAVSLQQQMAHLVERFYGLPRSGTRAQRLPAAHGILPPTSRRSCLRPFLISCM
jgi:hypothetical protein